MKILRQLIYLLCSEIIGLASWGATLPTWDAALEINNLWKGAAIAASILLAWLGYSPIKPKLKQ